MNLRKPVLILAFLLTVLSSCTWVKPTADGSGVVVAENDHVRQCKRVSTITTSVKHMIGSMDRKAEKVRQELITLGRNEAAIRDGDTIVPRSGVENGSMTFDVYQCG